MKNILILALALAGSAEFAYADTTYNYTSSIGSGFITFAGTVSPSTDLGLTDIFSGDVVVDYSFTTSDGEVFNLANTEVDFGEGRSDDKEIFVNSFILDAAGNVTAFDLAFENIYDKELNLSDTGATIVGEESGNTTYLSASDGVFVLAVPETDAWIMLMLGLPLMSWIALRKQNL